MKLNYWIISLGLFLLTSCSNTKEKEKGQTLSFKEYKSEIVDISLPFKNECQNHLNGIRMPFADSLLAKFRPKNAHILGKIADNESYTAIIYLFAADIPLPVIQTTDSLGKKISSIALYEKYCGEDEFSIGKASFEISKNVVQDSITNYKGTEISILLNDSSTTFERNKKGEVIEKSKKTETRKRKFKIDVKGQISFIPDKPNS